MKMKNAALTALLGISLLCAGCGNRKIGFALGE
ncbi:MAG: hypothetical protein Pg6C_18260 [Treponemataceae bacterium]|nr:MAG: hypothetical protein Pg6C_18260 [Treponemataceae bacterium]